MRQWLREVTNPTRPFDCSTRVEKRRGEHTADAAALSRQAHMCESICVGEVGVC